MWSNSDSMRDMVRAGIVERSIEILRAHGKSDEEIRAMMLKDFAISEEALDKLLNSKDR